MYSIFEKKESVFYMNRSTKLNFIELDMIASARKYGSEGVKVGLIGAMQYRKWLAYMPEFLQERISEISTKPFNDLSIQEGDFLLAFSEQQKVLENLEKYFTDKWCWVDYEFVRAYIAAHPLSEIKKQRLTDEEYNGLIEMIRQKYGDYSEEEILEISNGINILNPGSFERNKEYYDSLSIGEAFVYDFSDNLRFRLGLLKVRAAALEDEGKSALVHAYSEIEAAKSIALK